MARVWLEEGGEGSGGGGGKWSKGATDVGFISRWCTHINMIEKG